MKNELSQQKEKLENIIKQKENEIAESNKEIEALTNQLKQNQSLIQQLNLAFTLRGEANLPLTLFFFFIFELLPSHSFFILFYFIFFSDGSET